VVALSRAKPTWVGTLLARCTILTPRPSLRLPPRSVVLTFDDGPNPHRDITARLLDTLRQNQVKACFCVVGRQVERGPALLRRIDAEGHVLVNHTNSHRLPLVQSKTSLAGEIEACDRAIGAALGVPGYRSDFFRPPYGLLTPAVWAVVRARAMTVVPISHYALDASCGPSSHPAVVRRILQNAEANDGGVYVLHDKKYDGERESSRALDDPHSGTNRDWVPGAVEALIPALRAKGLTFLDPRGWLELGV
jgi:peptidoglycan/xylan/chitin deacetylase (PgdA/CDA1 family)